MEENISQKEKEKAEEEMIEQAFQELLNDYLATKHRKRVEIKPKHSTLPTRRIRASSVVPASPTSCTPLLWQRLSVMR